MNIFEASHALLEIELAAQEQGVTEGSLVHFLMWISDDKFPGEPFDDPLIAKLLSGMKALVEEYHLAVDMEIEGSRSFTSTSL